MAPKSKENQAAYAGFLSVCPSVTEKMRLIITDL